MKLTIRKYTYFLGIGIVVFAILNLIFTLIKFDINNVWYHIGHFVGCLILIALGLTLIIYFRNRN